MIDLETIGEICKSNITCESCPLSQGEEMAVCAFDYFPSDWDVEKIQEVLEK